ncbi:hypothetical protein [Prochlorococcus sp. MIT 1341]|uniref:hypothetical protein n=1 Tax=Prochlorococcus sp. MIT 1341 TaxID=3096221 RepID=UPI002A7593C4|nr:hypothetical protein [Prochlorococcus sp. MIT 1341]
MMPKVQQFSLLGIQPVMDLHQGDCVQLTTSDDLFQVIGVDDHHNRCWLRRWPLLPKGSPVFEVSMKHISTSRTFSKLSIN